MAKIFITLTGTKHYFGNDFLEKGMKIRLEKEPDNEYDKEAIKVTYEGLGKIGYVANSSYTVIGESMSAGRLYDKIGDTAYVPVFSNNDNQKMLAAIKECISLAKGCEPTNEEVWKFCKAFILLLFDMDCAESVNRALSASLIKCNSPENPILVWSRLVEYAGQCNQAAASVSKENIDRNIRDLFSKNNIIQLPPDPITAIDLFIPTIALIGAWKEDNEFDCKMIEQISGMEYSEFEAKARTMLSQNSEYLQLMNGNWKVCHKEELLNQCKNKLFDDSIGKLLEVVESILRQKSKCVASKMPYFIPVSGEYDNSLELRGNLVKSLCWVKKNLSELSQCNQEKIENNIYTLVSTLLQDAKWITYLGLIGMVTLMQNDLIIG